MNFKNIQTTVDLQSLVQIYVPLKSYSKYYYNSHLDQTLIKFVINSLVINLCIQKQFIL